MNQLNVSAMKKLLALFIVSLFFYYGFAQPLTGTKTIKTTGGDYSSFTTAIAALNANGVGTGGVIFNVDAGFIDSVSNLIISDTTANFSNQIIFQKSGNGNNPLIIAKTGTGNMDGIIKIAGTDYISFNKIDLTESSANTSATTMMEWGYALLKSATKNGCNHVVIKYCHINLNKSNTNATYGIYSANHTTTSTTELIISDTSGSNSYNRFFSDSISNVFGGIYIKGSGTGTSTPIYDQNNKIGVDGGNSITNFSGSGNTTDEAGIYGSYQNNLVIANNIIIGGNGSTTAINGILTSYGTNCNIDIYNNTITLSSSVTSSSGMMAGIRNSIGHAGTSSTISIHKNSIQNCKYSGTSGLMFYGIMNSAQGYTVNMYDNDVSFDTIGGTGRFIGFYQGNCTYLNFYSNMVYNNRKSGGGDDMICITLVSDNLNCYNNTIHDNSLAAGTGTLFGYNSEANGSINENVYNNKVYNLSHAGTGSVYGLYSSSSTSTLKKIYGNSIYSLSSGLGSITGIYSGKGINTSIYKNQVYNLTSLSNTVNGIYTASDATVYIYNNFISDLKSPASTSNTAIYGMYLGGTGYNYAAYNSVFLNASCGSTTNFGTTALYSNSGTSLELRNNILVNISAHGPTGGKTTSFWRPSISLPSYTSLSDNNCFYSGTPSSKNVIFFTGGQFDSTITDFKKRVSTRDVNSFSEKPPFVNVTNTPYNLHLLTNLSTACESGGLPVKTPIKITDDIDGNVRDTINPDVGAHEGKFILSDKMPPSCNYQPLINTFTLTARTLTATITDPSSVPVTGNGKPVLRWKKNYNGNWIGVTSTYIGNNKFNFTFGSGVATNDTVFYFILAQDSATLPNVGAYPSTAASGYSSNPPSVTNPPSNPNYYRILGVLPGGNYRIGGSGTTPAVGCTYVDITDALADLSERQITGAINLILTKYYASAEEDSFPLLVKTVQGQDSINTITLKPDTNVITSISRISTTSIFKFEEAKYFIIDGSNNGSSSKDLTITNTSTVKNTAVVWIGSKYNGPGNSHITIKNCNISMGSNTVNNFGITISNNTSLTSNGADNDNITLEFNQITKCSMGIYVSGSAYGTDDYLNISNNIIGSSIAGNFVSSGLILYSYVNNSTFNQNVIFNLRPSSATSTALYGIYVSLCITNSIFSKNKIYDIVSGSITVYGISVNHVTNTNLQFDNNILYGIMSYVSGAGIYCYASKNNSFYYNSINLTGDRDPLGTMKPTTPSYAFYTGTGVTGLILKNNIIKNSMLAATNPTTAKSYGMYNAGTAATFTEIDHNDYFVSGLAGILAYQGIDRTTLSDWKSASVKDSNSLNVDPMFISDVDLHVSSSYLNDAGDTTSKVKDDIEGNVRSLDHPDIGVYEFDLKATAITLGSDQILGSKATVWGKVNPMNEYNTTVAFEYGTTTAYGFSATAVQSPVQGLKDISINANLTGLLPQTTYHYRIAATTSAGITYGKDSTLKTTVGIEENKSVQAARIYMNGKNLIVECSSDISDAQIMVYDLFGKEVFSGTMKGKKLQLSLGNSAAGYYLVSITTDQTVLNRKVFVK
jgi:trimeric autotransporter adhesin